MRKVLLTAAALALFGSSASAQSTGSWVGSLGGGITFPMGDFGDGWDMGFHGNANLGYKKADSKMTWLVDAGFHRLGAKDFDSDANIFTALGRMDYDASTNMYVTVGAGVMRNEYKTSISGTEFTNTNSNFALAGGVGYKFGKSLALEGRFINGFAEEGSTLLIPITLKVRF